MDARLKQDFDVSPDRSRGVQPKRHPTEAKMAAVLPNLSVVLVAMLLHVVFAVQTADAHSEHEPSEFFATMALCRPDPVSGCSCSFRTVETSATFAEAADLILNYYRVLPRMEYENLLMKLLRQCASEQIWPAPASEKQAQAASR